MSKTEKTPKLWSNRVIRGGSWFLDPQYARVANRSGVAGRAHDHLGVRLVEVLDEQD